MFDNFKNICVVSCGVCVRAAAECSAGGLTHSLCLPAQLLCWARLPLRRAGSGQQGLLAPCLPAVSRAGLFYLNYISFSRVEGP